MGLWIRGGIGGVDGEVYILTGFLMLDPVDFLEAWMER